MSEMLYQEAAVPMTENAQAVTTGPHTQKLKEETKDLVAEFSGRKSLDRFLDSIRAFYNTIRKDSEAPTYLKDLKSFILTTRDPQHVRSEEFRQQSRDLIERGRRITDRLRNTREVDDFLNASDALLNNINNNELVATLRERGGIVVDDLTYEDDEGKRQLNIQLLLNIRKVIVPVMADALKYIPIPKIEDRNGKREYVVDNIVLCGYDVIPENIFVRLEADSWINVKELEAERSHTSLIVALRNFRTEIKDIKFHYKRLSFPQMSESGVVTFRIGGKGANLTMAFKVEQRPSDTVPKFTGGRVDFFIDQMDIEFDKSTLNHDILVPMITSLFKRNLIHSIERAVEKNLGGAINDMGQRLTDALTGLEPRFSTRLNELSDKVKRGEFSHTYRQRQEKLTS